MVSDPKAVARHSFLPLVGYSKKERRYRRRPGEMKPVASTKVRELVYPSNRDGHIFAFYADRLSILYEAELAALASSKVVIGIVRVPPTSSFARCLFRNSVPRELRRTGFSI